MSAAVAAPLDVALRDGSTVRVRAVEPADAEALLVLLGGLSEESRWLRFFSAGADVRAAARHAAHVAEAGGAGLVALAGERIVGHAEFLPERPGVAEVAFEVAEDWQGHGIATLLLAHLAHAAAALGIETFTAHVLASNHRMARVFRESGFPVHVQAAEGELALSMPASLSAQARERFESRDHVAAVAAVAHVLRPASVAVVGASEREGSVGAAVLRNLLAGGYAGRLHVVHPQRHTVAGVPAHRDVRDILGGAELAVVAVAAEDVPAVARACGEAGVRALLVLSAGFAEVGEAGRARQAELLAACRRFGMRLVGPSSLGVIDTASDVRLDATFAPEAPTPGRLAFGSQSGAYGIAGIAEMRRRGLELSSFVSMGDKADLSGNDLLRYWDEDPGTDAVLLYLESFGNPRRFGRIARQVAKRKPVIAVKAGRSTAGRRAAGSHTGALVAASDAAVDALFDHAGVIRTATLDEMLDVAALTCGPLPAGGRVAIVTNAGGPGIACAGACEAAGLAVPPTGERARERLSALLPATASLGNPVDLLASASPSDFGRAVGSLAEEGDADAVLVIVVPTLVTAPAAVAAALAGPAAEAAGRGTPVVVACGTGGRAVELLRDVQVRLAPLTGFDAHEMLRALRTFPLLDGYGGARPADVAALEDVLVRLGALAAAHPEIAELDCDPLLAGPDGAVVLDARARVAAVAAPRPFPSLDR